MSSNNLELFDLVQKSLEQEGLLQTFKAQLRANVLRILTNLHGDQLSKSSKQKLIEEYKNNPNGFVGLLLVKDLLQKLQLKETLLVYEAETGLDEQSNNSMDEAKIISTALNINTSNSSVPILMTLIQSKASAKSEGPSFEEKSSTPYSVPPMSKRSVEPPMAEEKPSTNNARFQHDKDESDEIEDDIDQLDEHSVEEPEEPLPASSSNPFISSNKPSRLAMALEDSSSFEASSPTNSKFEQRPSLSSEHHPVPSSSLMSGSHHPTSNLRPMDLLPFDLNMNKKSSLPPVLGSKSLPPLTSIVKDREKQLDDTKGSVKSPIYQFKEDLKKPSDIEELVVKPSEVKELVVKPSDMKELVVKPSEVKEVRIEPVSSKSESKGSSDVHDNEPADPTGRATVTRIHQSNVTRSAVGSNRSEPATDHAVKSPTPAMEEERPENDDSDIETLPTASSHPSQHPKEGTSQRSSWMPQAASNHDEKSRPHHAYLPAGNEAGTEAEEEEDEDALMEEDSGDDVDKNNSSSSFMHGSYRSNQEDEEDYQMQSGHRGMPSTVHHEGASSMGKGSVKGGGSASLLTGGWNPLSSLSSHPKKFNDSNDSDGSGGGRGHGPVREAAEDEEDYEDEDFEEDGPSSSPVRKYGNKDESMKPSVEKKSITAFPVEFPKKNPPKVEEDEDEVEEIDEDLEEDARVEGGDDDEDEEEAFFQPVTRTHLPSSSASHAMETDENSDDSDPYGLRDKKKGSLGSSSAMSRTQSGLLPSMTHLPGSRGKVSTHQYGSSDEDAASTEEEDRHKLGRKELDSKPKVPTTRQFSDKDVEYPSIVSPVQVPKYGHPALDEEEEDEEEEEETSGYIPSMNKLKVNSKEPTSSSNQKIEETIHDIDAKLAELEKHDVDGSLARLKHQFDVTPVKNTIHHTPTLSRSGSHSNILRSSSHTAMLSDNEEPEEDAYEDDPQHDQMSTGIDNSDSDNDGF